MTTVGAALDDGLRQDLRAWLRGYHAERARLMAVRIGESADRVFEGERRRLIGLSAVLMLGIASIPWLGPAGVLGGLVILYVGTIGSAVATLWRVRRLRAGLPPPVPPDEIERVVAACPALDAGGRAVLVRLINLSTTQPTARSRELLREALDEALKHQDLGGWGFLHDVSALYSGPDADRVGPLVGAEPAEATSSGRSRFGVLRNSADRPR